MKRCTSCKRQLHDRMRFCPFDGGALIDEDPLIGTLLDGRYRLEEKLGEAEIVKEYKAADTRLGREVAVKLFRLDPNFDQEAFNRLSKKLSATSSFYHPNLISIFDYGVVEDSLTAYLVFEFIEGISLKEKIKRGRLTYDEALIVIEQVCSALESLHTKGVIHGNLNSEDIRLYGDNVKQLELQLVNIDSLSELKENSGRVRLTRTSGAEDYMSPERIQDEGINARADVYSLGVILYEMLSGRLPFEASTQLESFQKRLDGRPNSLRSARPDILKPVEDVVLRALSRRPQQRQSSAAQLQKELQEAIGRKAADESSPQVVAPKGRVKEKPVYLDENVQFTVYRPNRVRPQEWYTMLAFAHLSERPPDAPAAFDPVEEVRKQAVQILGDEARDYRTIAADSRLAVPREGELVMVPDMPGVEFNPPFSTFLWQEPVHRQEFRLRASAAANGQAVWGRLSVYLGSILLAEVGLSIRVDSNYDPKSKTAPQDVAQARAFRRIFASYSHKDVSIVEQFERIARASGDDFIRDWTHLRAGEVWNDRLKEMINAATIFQLFWSSNSMMSSFVRQEWEYALSLNRANFIRPVYWEEPFPELREQGLPPASLKRLQFHRLINGAGSHPQITPDEADTERIAPRPATEHSVCGSCGKSKPAATRFCPYCGARGSQTITSQPQAAQPNKPMVDTGIDFPADAPAMRAPQPPPTYSTAPDYGQQDYAQSYPQGHQQSHTGDMPYGAQPPEPAQSRGRHLQLYRHSDRVYNSWLTRLPIYHLCA